MTVDLFQNFDLDSQACLTWKKGVHIGYRTQGCFYISLYRLYDFYVEIYYHINLDGVVSVKAILCEDELQSYLEQVNISALLH